mgnify:CR=1 FL=1
MKILVPVKRVADAAQPLRIAADGRSIDADSVVPIINPFDAIALEEAVRLREKGADVSEIVVVSIGPAAAEKELRGALAVGADRALLLETEASIDPWNVSAVLQSIILTEAPDLVIMGKQAVDDDSNQVGQFLAARLGWPQATFASEMVIIENGLSVRRETDHGIETTSLSLPAVVTCDLRLNEPRYAPLPAILKAKRKPLEVRPLTECGIVIEPRVEVVALEPVNATRSCKMVESVPELAEQLKRAAKLSA